MKMKAQELTFKKSFKIGAGLTAGAMAVYALTMLLFGLAQMLAMYLLS